MPTHDIYCEYTIITPTTGHKDYLERCVRSVQNQKDIAPGTVRHMVVIDGKCRSSDVQHVMSKLKSTEYSGKWNIPVDIMELPYPTGTNLWNGHRIYGAVPFLCNAKYISFLDEDNSLESIHCKSVLDTFGRDPSLRWIFTLRNLMTPAGNIVGKDMCESLGDLAPAWNTKQYFLDTGGYILTQKLATQLSPFWFVKARQPNEMDADRAVSHVLLKQQLESLKHACTNKFTLNYMVGNRTDSVQMGFFERGNEYMKVNHSHLFKRLTNM